MEEILGSTIVKALVFSTYDKLGPQPFYMFPKFISEKDYRENLDKSDKESVFRFTLRDYTQISIKNLSLFISDGKILENDNIEQIQYFAILPYPDFNATSLTYFHYIPTKFSDEPLASSFSVLVDEDRRSFLYNNINRIKPIILEFFEKFDKEIIEGYKEQSEVEPQFLELLKKIMLIEKSPSTIITSQRKIKIILAGLDDSGKTSFLLSIDRRYSKLIGLKPTSGAKVDSIEALGGTIFLWDLGGQEIYRKKYLAKAHIYLYEADLLFYFIDIRNKDRFDESIEYFQNIKSLLDQFNQNTPVVFILSKGDPDIVNSDEVKENINKVKEKLSNILKNNSFEIYITSIFQIFTILRAFSSGISKLSPNRDLINLNLKNFSIKTDAYLTLLLSVDGLVLADFHSPNYKKLIEIPESELVNVFEVSAPQLAVIYKIFSKFKALQKEEAIFKVAESVILLKKVNITDLATDLFILFLLDEEKKKKIINKKIDGFLTQTKDLLLRYIT